MRDITPVQEKTILCVDDEEGILASLCRLLHPYPYRIVTAGDGREALEKVLEDRPHLILLDVRMPRLDGYGVLKRLREDGMADIPVVLLTVESADENIMKGYCEGSMYYITKPFRNEYVLNIIEYLIGDPTRERKMWLEQRL